MKLFEGIPQAPEDRSRWYWFVRKPMTPQPGDPYRPVKEDVDAWAQTWEPRLGYLTGVGGLLIPGVTFGKIESDGSTSFWFAIGPVEEPIPPEIIEPVLAYLNTMPEGRR